MKIIAIIGAAALLAVTSYAIAVSAPARHAATPHSQGDKLAAKAEVSLDEAKEIALKARPGVVTDQELEKEGGGSRLRYSFDIKADNVPYEVGVDASTGAVLENGAEGKNPD